MIRWIPAVLTAILLTGGGYFGARRGFQKSLIRLVTLFAAIGLFLVLLPLCAEPLLLRLAEKTGLYAGSLNDLATGLLSRYTTPASAPLLARPAEAILLSTAIPVFLSVLYWPVHLLSWFIYLTVLAALPPSKRRAYNKSRKKTGGKFAGTIVGMAGGLTGSVFTLLPFILAGSVIEQTGKELFPTDYGIRETVACYYDSPVSPLYRAAGIEEFAEKLNRLTATVRRSDRNYLNQEELILLLPEFHAAVSTYASLSGSAPEVSGSLSGLHSALMQFYELPYWNDSEKLILLKEAKSAIVAKLPSTQGFMVKLIKYLDYDQLEPLKKDTEIYFELLERLQKSGNDNIPDQETAEWLTLQMCRLSKPDTVLPAWMNYLAEALTGGRIPKLIDAETFRQELKNQETLSQPASSDKVLSGMPKEEAEISSKEPDSNPAIQTPDNSVQTDAAANTSVQSTLKKIYTEELKPLLDLLYWIETPVTGQYQAFRQQIFETLAGLKENPLIGIWNYTSLHNYSRSRLALHPEERTDD